MLVCLCQSFNRGVWLWRDCGSLLSKKRGGFAFEGRGLPSKGRSPAFRAVRGSASGGRDLHLGCLHPEESFHSPRHMGYYGIRSTSGVVRILLHFNIHNLKPGTWSYLVYVVIFDWILNDNNSWIWKRNCKKLYPTWYFLPEVAGIEQSMRLFFGKCSCSCQKIITCSVQ